MKAIRTFYKGPGARGARMWATDDDGNRAHIPYDYSGDANERHKQAALALCTKMKWSGDFVGGYLGNEMVWVWLSPHESMCPKLSIPRHDTVWSRYAVAKHRSNTDEYQIWKSDQGGVTIYNVTDDGRPPSETAGGYSVLNMLLDLKMLELKHG